MIVLVDDDLTVLKVYRAILSNEGFVVEPFESAKDALCFLRTKEPDLIISDIMMPEIDGFEFRARYSDTFPERYTPFIFITGYSKYRSIVEASGVDGYLEKPVRREVLIEKVRSLLNGHATGIKGMNAYQ